MKAKKGTKLHEWQLAAKEAKRFCRRCKKLRWLTVDHIIPVSFLNEIGCEVGIYEDERNFQFLCKTCNHFKSNRIDIADDVAKKLLLGYVRML